MEKLKELRKKIDLTYTEFAEQIGISKTYYWQIENNTRGLSYNLAYKIAKQFGLKPDDLFYDEFDEKLK